MSVNPVRAIDHAMPAQTAPRAEPTDPPVDAPRSDYGAVPGAELPAAAYWTMLAAYLWMFATAWLVFATGMEADLVLMVATVLATIVLGLLLVIRRMTRARASTSSSADTTRVEIATGSLSEGEAYAQVAVIPLALALGAMGFGAAFLASH